MDSADGKAPGPPEERLLAAARAGDLDAVRAALADGADADTLGFHFASAVQTALVSGDPAWLRRTSARSLRPADPPHPHQVRAREVAASLGKVDRVSTIRALDQSALSWGFHVEPGPASGEHGLAVGVSTRSPVLVIVRGQGEDAEATAVIAKTLACAPQLYAGATLCPPTLAYYGSDADVVAGVAASYRFTDPGAEFPADALVATPARGRTVGMLAHRERLTKRLIRLTKLIALDAPEAILDDERRRIMEAFLGLTDAGWEPRLDPLPKDLRTVLIDVIDVIARWPMED